MLSSRSPGLSSFYFESSSPYSCTHIVFNSVFAHSIFLLPLSFDCHISSCLLGKFYSHLISLIYILHYTFFSLHHSPSSLDEGYNSVTKSQKLICQNFTVSGFPMILVECFILHILPKDYMSTPYINGMNCN